jgi:trans-aconitate methyltransferase
MNIRKIAAAITDRIKSYNYADYWKQSGMTYYDKFVHTDGFQMQEDELVRLVRQLEFKSVFEIGCGFGRVTKLLMDSHDIEKYDAIDISEHQIRKAKAVKGVTFMVSDFMSYVPTGKYDLVIASEVLMHIPPAIIGAFVKKMLDISNHYVLSIDVFGSSQKLARHNFIHQYPNLYQDHMVRPINLKNGQYMFLVTK